MSRSKAPARSWTWIFKTFFFLAIGGTFAALAIAGGILWHFSHDLPNIITVDDYHPRLVTRIVATGVAGAEGAAQPSREPKVIGEYSVERRYLVPYEKIPQIVVRAFISAEDDRFFEHPGVNLVSMIRAAIANFRAGQVVQGGSTITQQVAKSLLLTPERSFGRKIKEVILAYSIEKRLTKQQILYLYLNQIYLGHGAHGVQAAARTYFRKDVSELSIAEAALLAGLPQAPGKYSPNLNPKKAKERQLYVLRRLYENRYINQSEMNTAAAQPLRIFHDEDVNQKYAPYLVEHIRRYLVEKYGNDAVYEEGLTVLVPTSAELAQAAAKSLREGLELVDKRQGYRGPIKKFANNDEIEKFLKDLRAKLIERKLHFQMFLPDGRLDPYEAIKAGGLASEADLLTANESYPAVVVNVDDKKGARVMLGAIAADLPADKMKWAGSGRAPSKILTKGDVILVKALAKNGNSWTVSLEQDPEVQGALISMEAKTGYVLAMQGGYTYDKSEFNRAIQAMRQPGSSFKPIIYTAALEKGYTPASIIVDSPIVYDDAENGKWKPNNFEEKFYGDTTFRQALVKSRNVPTIKIVQSLQVPNVLDFAKRLGLNGQFNPDLSISLGSGSVSLMDITTVYGVFPRLGRKVHPIFFTKILDRDGKVLEENKPDTLPASIRIPEVQASPAPAGSPQPIVSPVQQANPNASPTLALPSYPLADDPQQVLDPRVAYVATNLMKEVVTHGTGHEAMNLGRVSAGKTGTTNEYVDAWYVGFTPHVVTGAWVGFDNRKTIGHSETGARAALPIWLGFMREAVTAYPDEDFTVPPGVVFASIDAQSGKLVPPNSLNAIREAFIEGTQPTETADKTKTKPATQSDFFKEDIQ